VGDGWALVVAMGAVLVPLGVAAVTTLVGLLSARKRAERLARWAGGRGWTLTPSIPALATRWSGHPFDTGKDPAAENVLSGPFEAYEAVVFDLSHRIARQQRSLFDHLGIANGAAGSSGDTRSYGVHALVLPCALPRLHLAAERRTDRAASRLLGTQDVELESHEFNQAYRVRADDVRLAYEVLNARTMDVLLAAGGPDVRIDGNSIVLVTPDPVDLDMVDAALAVLATVVENVPGYVWSDRGATAPRPRGGGGS